MMTALGNVLWLILGGFLAALGYWLGGILLCLTIIGIPFGLKCIRIGTMVLLPFGKHVSPTPRGEGCVALFFNVLWLILFGWEIALTHLIGGVIFAITIIGLPLARQHFKLVPVALFPFSYRLE